MEELKPCPTGIEQIDELRTLAKPLQDWMIDNFNMMHKIETTCDSVTVFALKWDCR